MGAWLAAAGLEALITPVVEDCDKHVEEVLASQASLSTNIDRLTRGTVVIDRHTLAPCPSSHALPSRPKGGARRAGCFFLVLEGGGEGGGATSWEGALARRARCAKGGWGRGGDGSLALAAKPSCARVSAARSDGGGERVES